MTSQPISSQSDHGPRVRRFRTFLNGLRNAKSMRNCDDDADLPEVQEEGFDDGSLSEGRSKHLRRAFIGHKVNKMDSSSHTFTIMEDEEDDITGFVSDDDDDEFACLGRISPIKNCVGGDGSNHTATTCGTEDDSANPLMYGKHMHTYEPYGEMVTFHESDTDVLWIRELAEDEESHLQLNIQGTLMPPVLTKAGQEALEMSYLFDSMNLDSALKEEEEDGIVNASSPPSAGRKSPRHQRRPSHHRRLLKQAATATVITETEVIEKTTSDVSDGNNKSPSRRRSSHNLHRRTPSQHRKTIASLSAMEDTEATANGSPRPTRRRSFHSHHRRTPVQHRKTLGVNDLKKETEAVGGELDKSVGAPLRRRSFHSHHRRTPVRQRRSFANFEDLMGQTTLDKATEKDGDESKAEEARSSPNRRRSHSQHRRTPGRQRRSFASLAELMDAASAPIQPTEGEEKSKAGESRSSRRHSRRTPVRQRRSLKDFAELNAATEPTAENDNNNKETTTSPVRRRSPSHHRRTPMRQRKSFSTLPDTADANDGPAAAAQETTVTESSQLPRRRRRHSKSKILALVEL